MGLSQNDNMSDNMTVGNRTIYIDVVQFDLDSWIDNWWHKWNSVYVVRNTKHQHIPRLLSVAKQGIGQRERDDFGYVTTVAPFTNMD